MKILRKINPKILLILFGLLMTNTGSFMVLPFLSLYLSRIHVSAAMIGVVLMINVICQRGLTFIGGLLNDVFGRRKLLIIGLSIRTCGYLMYCFAGHITLIMLASAFIGLGGALFAPGLMASIAGMAGDLKPEVFALRNTAVNLGSAIGPILGGLLYTYSVVWVFLLTACVHLIFLVILWFAGPKDIIAEKRPQLSFLFGSTVRHRVMIILVVLNTFFWFAYSQFNLTVPLYLGSRFHAGSLSGILFTINGLFVILFQYAVAKTIYRKFSGRQILSLGFLLMAIAFFIIGGIPCLIAVFIFVIFFSLSEVVVFPTIDNLVSEWASKEMLASCYGFVDIGWAMGATFGNLLGGIIFGVVQTHRLYAWMWFGYAGLCMAAVIIIFIAGRAQSIDHEIVK